MQQEINKITDSLENLRNQIINHKVYTTITTLEDLKIFMQFHVYAVWDFMCLLKTLQNNLTCTTVPWFPKGNADTRFLINEIVVGEESDVDMNGIRKSHFELYLEAMEQCGADTREINLFLQNLVEKNDLNTAFNLAKTPYEAKEFVSFTFKIIHSNQVHLQSAIFTFGREDLIPNMFMSIVNDLNKKFPNNISIFKYYLDRHIEVDGDHHSHLALQMTQNLCGNNPTYWNDALSVSIESLEKRIQLWDGAYNAIMQNKLNHYGLKVHRFGSD
jgi:hypothetical protein